MVMIIGGKGLVHFKGAFPKTPDNVICLPAERLKARVEAEHVKLYGRWKEPTGEDLDTSIIWEEEAMPPLPGLR